MHKLLTADGRPGRLLLVDDDEADVLGFRNALAQLGLSVPVTTACDGAEALQLLREQDRNDSPCIVLLDLNMPRMGGIEFLAELRADPELRRTIVFVLTTSVAERDRNRAYDFNIAGYISKSTPEHSVQEVVRLLKLYSSIVQMPAA